MIGKELASDTTLDKVLCICSGRRPIEPCMEGLANKGPSCGVVHRYGVPHSIITDNGSNFTSDEVKTWCANLGIKLNYASVYHPQTNGQFERANGLIMSGIKPRLVRSLKESDMHWVKELDSELW